MNPEDSEATRFPGLFPAKEEPLSPFYTMLRSAPPDYLAQRDEPVDFPSAFPVHYFFYGTLTAPAQVKRILDLPEEPQLREAEMDVVTGSAYLVRSEEEAQKLSYYETNAYEVADCWVHFKDEKEPKETGYRVFMYAGDAQALLDQQFDRKLWSQQMQGKLG
ncbi:hypothetical protein CBS147332_7216 [Penicillium roqueforti]|nr:hypothetical protein CBS147332_7216 [Penicillium roqueforti]KAI3101023.1 hypothetical protein CBS147331_8046 [Penicillium roqueforti]